MFEFHYTCILNSLLPAKGDSIGPLKVPICHPSAIVVHLFLSSVFYKVIYFSIDDNHSAQANKVVYIKDFDMITGLLAKIIGTANERQLKRLRTIVLKINAFEPHISGLTDAQLGEKTNYFREQLFQGKTLDDILPEAFATVREAAKRNLGNAILMCN